MGDHFEKGTLYDCPNGRTLRSFFSKKLHCAPMRISKKFAGKSIGKHVFLSRLARTPHADMQDNSTRMRQLEYHFHLSLLREGGMTEQTRMMNNSVLPMNNGFPHFMNSPYSVSIAGVPPPHSSFFPFVGSNGQPHSSMKVGMGMPPFSNQNFAGQSQFPQFSRMPIAGFHPQGKKLLDAFKKAQKAGKSKKRSEGTTDGRKCKRNLKETKKKELEGNKKIETDEEKHSATAEISCNESCKDKVSKALIEEIVPINVTPQEANIKKIERNITSEPKAIQTKILNSTVDYDNNTNDKMTKIATATSEISTTGNSQLTHGEDMSEFLSDLDMHDYSDSRKKSMTNHNAQIEWLSETMTMMSDMDYSSSVNPEYSSIENQSFVNLPKCLDESLKTKGRPINPECSSIENQSFANLPQNQSFANLPRCLDESLKTQGRPLLKTVPMSNVIENSTCSSAHNFCQHVSQDVRGELEPVTADDYAMFAQESATAVSQHSAYCNNASAAFNIENLKAHFKAAEQEVRYDKVVFDKNECCKSSETTSNLISSSLLTSHVNIISGSEQSSDKGTNSSQHSYAGSGSDNVYDNSSGDTSDNSDSTDKSLLLSNMKRYYLQAVEESAHNTKKRRLNNDRTIDRGISKEKLSQQ